MNLRTISLFFALPTVAAFGYNANFTVNTTQGKLPISQYIFGANTGAGNYGSATNSAENFTIERGGHGDRSEAYNWEINASNSGGNNGNSNDMQMTSELGLSSTQARIPGIFMTRFQDTCVARGIAGIQPVQMNGYVAADGAGTVSCTAPCGRWVPIAINKGSAYENPPNLTDGNVYMDEMVNMLVTKYGQANTATGVKFYCLDNEPDIWQSTFAIIHPAHVTCAELISKSIQTAQMIKRLDPFAQVMGPSLCCFSGYFDLQTAPDWATVKETHQWFVSWYLDKMKKAEDSLHTAGLLPAGVRLLDVLDLHFYSDGDMSTYQGLVQNPRILWDGNYHESSWIQQYHRAFQPYYPRIISNINQYYPGTKFGHSEWNYGSGDNSIATSMTIADALGIFVKYGAYFSTYWDVNAMSSAYVSAAYRIFRNYDGGKSIFGDTAVSATMSDTTNASIYAATITKGSNKELHIILINKNQTDALNAACAMTMNYGWSAGEVWQYGSTSAAITRLSTGVTISNGSFTTSLPAQSVTHIVFTAPLSSMGTRTGRCLINSGAMRLTYSAQLKTLNFFLPKNNGARVRITDMAGRLIGNFETFSEHECVPLRKSTGLYVVDVESQHSSMHTKVLVQD